MSRRKIYKYECAEQLANVIQHPKHFFENCRGKWMSDYFKNSNPIVLEIGCGRGEYTNGLGKLFPSKNFIGVDIKGDRLAAGGQQAEVMQLTNVAFLRIQIQFIEDFFLPNEIDEIWITFPDPRMKDRDEKKRLTFPFYLEKYLRLLKPGGLIHLKTDSSEFFEYSLAQFQAYQLQSLAETKDLYTSIWNEDHFGIKTRFEKIWFDKGYTINYARVENKKEA
ncbi:tRNA (guanosine(46)-N7)-methyltransferase TrmB [Aquirufa sp.]|uniref:tRNA (guanosine(46)-N7)-methyltransferase TrmB n=1 Tax=Aquirufa sp. TaxID=2676249 RepID=UPI0037BF7274